MAGYSGDVPGRLFFNSIDIQYVSSFVSSACCAVQNKWGEGDCEGARGGICVKLTSAMPALSRSSGITQ